MKTIIVTIPDKKENFFYSLMKKFRFKTYRLTDEEMEEEAMAKWIDEGMKSEAVPMQKVLEHLRKHGVNC